MAESRRGKPYVPKKQRAAEAIAANPNKSDRAIAADLGLATSTVQDGAKFMWPRPFDEREGRDGKIYRLPGR